MIQKYMIVLANIIGAVESGGQVYGERNYAEYTPPYTGSEAEHTITLGWPQFYGNEGRRLMQMIYAADKAAFKAVDKNGKLKKKLAVDWETTRWNPTEGQKGKLIKLITSPKGKTCQDSLFFETMKPIVAECEDKYTKDPKAVIMYCEIRHLGGKKAAERIFDRLGEDYSLDSILSSLVKDQRDQSSDNQVGDVRYWSRHTKCCEFVSRYVEDSEAASVKGQKPEPVSGITAEQAIEVYRGWVGLSRSAGTHSAILDIYNAYIREHPGAGRNYQVQAEDAYCDTTFSAAFIKLHAVDAIGGVECGVEEHVKLFKAAGIWEEDGSITPQPGYGIVYNWGSSGQPNDGYSDHIGIVESVDGGNITCIEGNMSGGVVGRRTIPVGWGYIRGYVKPAYAQGKSEVVPAKAQKSLEELAEEVINGKWGNGAARVSALAAAGYDASRVQAAVNAKLLS